MSDRREFQSFVQTLQNEICRTLEQVDGHAVFREDTWVRQGGGGGRTCAMANGRLLEKAGVNTSVVYGVPPADLYPALHGNADSLRFYATGMSMVLHPVNPMVPTLHANVRYFELNDADGILLDAWFGGGIDLTPYYLFDEDVIGFHRTLRNTCVAHDKDLRNTGDAHDKGLYSRFKAECDTYFVNTHRNAEPRGVGGVFFDHLRDNELGRSLLDWRAFVMDVGQSILPSYLPIVDRRRNMHYTDKHVWWQEIRRGRYTEFNLIHDRGTRFGLQTNGRTESILMSLPPRARWEYDLRIDPDSEEGRMLDALIPRNWLPPEGSCP